MRDILIDQTRALRKRWLVEEFIAGRKRGAYWGIGTAIDSYRGGQPLAEDSVDSKELERVPTRLRSLDRAMQARLVNWGYALCDAALRTRSGLAVTPASCCPM